MGKELLVVPVLQQELRPGGCRRNAEGGSKCTRNPARSPAQRNGEQKGLGREAQGRDLPHHSVVCLPPLLDGLEKQARRVGIHFLDAATLFSSDFAELCLRWAHC
jgi:hypothetical protein